MRLQSQQFITLSGLTALDAMRQPICLLLMTACVAFITILPLLITHTLGESGKLVRDSALALHMVSGLLLGGFISCLSLKREMQHGTAASILSKPVTRVNFFLAKFTGMAVVMVLFSTAVAAATVLAARVAETSYGIDWWAAGPLVAAIVLAYAIAGLSNYFTRRPFASSAFVLLIVFLLLAFALAAFTNVAGQWTSFGHDLPLRIIPASILETLAILVLSGISLALATRLNALATISLCSLIFVIGLMSDYLLGQHAAGSTFIAALYYITPNWQHFWMADALTGGGTIPWTYVAHAAVYAVFYLAGVLCLGMLCFQRLEIDS